LSEHADLVKILKPRLVDGAAPLDRQHDLALPLERLLQRQHGLLASDEKRIGHGRERNEVPKRNGRVACHCRRTSGDRKVPSIDLQQRRQGIPVGNAQHFRNQLQVLAVADVDGLAGQGFAQVCAMVFASRKSRIAFVLCMSEPGVSGGCVADPVARAKGGR
jgi:hypothetical protein